MEGTNPIDFALPPERRDIILKTMELDTMDTPREVRMLLERRNALVDEAHLQLDARNIEEAQRLVGRAWRLHVLIESIQQEPRLVRG